MKKWTNERLITRTIYNQQTIRSSFTSKCFVVVTASLTLVGKTTCPSKYVVFQLWQDKRSGVHHVSHLATQPDLLHLLRRPWATSAFTSALNKTKTKATRPPTLGQQIQSHTCLLLCTDQATGDLVQLFNPHIIQCFCKQTSSWAFVIDVHNPWPLLLVVTRVA